MGWSPMTSSSVSVQPLKLIAKPPNARGAPGRRVVTLFFAIPSPPSIRLVVGGPARRLPIRRGYYPRTARGREGKNTIPGVSRRGRNYPVGYRPGGERLRMPRPIARWDSGGGPPRSAPRGGVPPHLPPAPPPAL